MVLTGGGWTAGSASFPVYNPENDIGLVEDVMVVTINYRLNVFGFLASGALRDEVCSPCTVAITIAESVILGLARALQQSDGSTGNYGLLVRACSCAFRIHCAASESVRAFC